MGVYVIGHKVHREWIKIGHHKLTARRPNVYFRFVRRGFYSCVSPPLLRECLDFEHVELLAFYPNLTLKEEDQIHRYLEEDACRRRCGEWFEDCDLDSLYGYIESSSVGGVLEMPTLADLEYAKERLKLV